MIATSPAPQAPAANPATTENPAVSHEDTGTKENILTFGLRGPPSIKPDRLSSPLADENS
jgi:hypothetical protein